jgi:hypothetical protein
MKTCAKTSKYRNAGTGIEVVFSKILPAEPRKEYILMYCTTLQYYSTAVLQYSSTVQYPPSDFRLT